MQSTRRTMEKLTMQRRHFQLIAEVLHGQMVRYPSDDHSIATWENIAKGFADALQSTNPGFDRLRFLEACRGEK